jgi:hypothetical protein
LNEHQNDPDASAQKEATYTGFLVIVGVAAIVVSALQYCAARNAAKASECSAEAAKLALKINRPFLILQRAEVDGRSSRRRASQGRGLA